MIHPVFVLTGLASVASYARPASGPLAQEVRAAEEALPSWIWLDETTDGQEVVFQRTFELAARPESAWLAGSCDNHMIVLLNGERVAVHGEWQVVAGRDVAEHLVVGENTLEVRAQNDGGPAGLALRLSLEDGDAIVTDASWQAALPGPARRGRFSPATVLGPVGGEGLPWSAAVTPASFAGAMPELPSAAPGEPQVARPAEGLNLLEGFRGELLYAVPNELEGTWVSLAKDDRGRLYASDEARRGIYRVTPATLGDPEAVTTVERVPVEVSGAQGMCQAFDALYVNVNGEGVWRLRDADGDDELDEAVNLIELGHGGEHGPHALLPTEDGEGLYFIAGNHTPPPAFDGSRVPSNWGEDLLLGRLWDANGHARGLLAPGGWIARCDPDGGNVELFSIGFRNQYDIALNARGELFTYDSDMEWDIGTPWYRPTRLCHVTSGSEFGWRSGTGKWPAWYEDSLPPVLDVGPGSPTGIVFGAGARFPARYQEALYVLDWTFGTIYAVHLEPDGASYRATKEDFAWAKPLAVTDAVVGDDGALYFTVGGRGSRSSLYRIVYAGDEPTAPVTPPPTDAGSPARARRRALEAFHGVVDPAALEVAWPELSSSDRFLRYAARVAVESQPVATWRARALAEVDPQAAVVALIALARQGGEEDLEPLLAALECLHLPTLPEEQRLAALRAYALAFVRLGEPGEALRRRVTATLDGLLPTGSPRVDRELVGLLVHLRSPTAVEKGLALMRAAGTGVLPEWAELILRNDSYGSPIAKMLADPPPIAGLAYALMLRNATEGWTLDRRKEYFEFFVEASRHPGGNSYAGFLRNIREEAAAHLGVVEARTLAPLLGQELLAEPPRDVTPPVGPGRRWTVAEAFEVVGEAPRGRSLEAGRNLFHAASCSTCHRFDGAGGAIGPDLTTVGNKFAVRDILEAMIEPSKVISDQYGSYDVLDLDGRAYHGLLVEDGDEVTIYPREVNVEPTTLLRSEIELMRESPLSQMPDGLVDGLNPDELRDLVAWLVSGGDPGSEVFAAPEGAQDGD